MSSTAASTKLVLQLPEMLIERAESFSQSSGKSVSQIVADYFASLPAGKTASPSAAGKVEAAPPPMPPIVASLYGLLKAQPVDENDYKQYLERKYL